MSMSKSTTGAIGCPPMFIRQFTRIVLLLKLLPIFRSDRDTPLTVYIACKLRFALYGSPPKTMVPPLLKMKFFLMISCMVMS